MARDTRHKKQVRAGPKAARAATKRLIAIHQDEYDRIYAEEAKKLGVSPMKEHRRAKIDRLKEQIAKLENK